VDAWSAVFHLFIGANVIERVFLLNTGWGAEMAGLLKHKDANIRFAWVLDPKKRPLAHHTSFSGLPLLLDRALSTQTHLAPLIDSVWPAAAAAAPPTLHLPTYGFVSFQQYIILIILIPCPDVR
jgi:hypothetical protein